MNGGAGEKQRGRMSPPFDRKQQGGARTQHRGPDGRRQFCRLDPTLRDEAHYDRWLCGSAAGASLGVPVFSFSLMPAVIAVLAVVAMVMTEDVHQRASQQKRKGNGLGQVGQVLGEQVVQADCTSQRHEDPQGGRPSGTAFVRHHQLLVRSMKLATGAPGAP